MNLLERVQFLCNRKNLTIARLEQELGFSRGSVYKWLNSTPGGDKLIAVSKYFNVTTDFLLGNDIFSVDALPEYPESGENSDGIKESFIDYCRKNKASAVEISKMTSIPVAWLEEYVSSEIKGFSMYIWEIIFDEYFGDNFFNFLNEYGLYADYILPVFNGEANKYETYKKAVDEDYEKNLAEKYGDVRMIARRAETLNGDDRQKLLRMMEAVFGDFDDEENHDSRL